MMAFTKSKVMESEVEKFFEEIDKLTQPSQETKKEISDSKDISDEASCSQSQPQENLLPQNDHLDQGTSYAFADCLSYQSEGELFQRKELMDKGILPEWQMIYDEQYKRHYYWNMKTNESVWKLPSNSFVQSSQLINQQRSKKAVGIVKPMTSKKERMSPLPEGTIIPISYYGSSSETSDEEYVSPKKLCKNKIAHTVTSKSSTEKLIGPELPPNFNFSDKEPVLPAISDNENSEEYTKKIPNMQLISDENNTSLPLLSKVTFEHPDNLDSSEEAAVLEVSNVYSLDEKKEFISFSKETVFNTLDEEDDFIYGSKKKNVISLEEMDKFNCGIKQQTDVNSLDKDSLIYGSRRPSDIPLLNEGGINYECKHAAVSLDEEDEFLYGSNQTDIFKTPPTHEKNKSVVSKFDKIELPSDDISLAFLRYVWNYNSEKEGKKKDRGKKNLIGKSGRHRKLEPNPEECVNQKRQSLSLHIDNKIVIDYHHGQGNRFSDEQKRAYEQTLNENNKSDKMLGRLSGNSSYRKDSFLDKGPSSNKTKFYHDSTKIDRKK